MLLFVASKSALAEVEQDLFSLSLEQLLKVKVDTSSNKLKAVREQPGTVSIITEEQIARSSARNLMQLLKQVPGFWHGTDTISTFSVSFRGIWGMEAKILLIVDGIEQNELAFGTLVLGHRYPTSTIKQVEIIRGPGGVKYGGQAALAVIKVTTKGEEFNTTHLAMSADLSSDGVYNSTYSLVSGGRLGKADDQLRYSMSASFGEGDYSDKLWTGLDGYSYNMSDRSNSRPLNFNFSIFNENYSARLIYDRFRQQDQLLFGDSGLFASPFIRYTEPSSLSFESLNFALNYRWKVGDSLELESKLTYVKQIPWRNITQFGQRTSRESERKRLDFTALFDYSKTSNILIGTSYYTEKQVVTESHLFDASTRYDGSNYDSSDDYSVYLQFESETEWASYTLGGRYERHDFSGSLFVPRLAVTKVWDKLHGKLVYNEAFKIPQFDTIASAKNAGTALSGYEKTKMIELELGYQQSQNFVYSGNIYWTEVTDYIGFDPAKISNATLGDYSGFGGEFILTMGKDNLESTLSYSVFQIDQTNIDVLTVEPDKEAILGIPNHMLKLQGRYNINENASLNVNGTLISSQYACVSDSNFVCGVPQKQSNEYDIDLFYRYTNNQYSYNLGIANIFDSDVLYIQPYRGSQSPIPGLGRRLMFNTEFEF